MRRASGLIVEAAQDQLDAAKQMRQVATIAQIAMVAASRTGMILRVDIAWGLFEQLFGWISVVAFPDFDVPGVNEGPLLLFVLVVLQIGLFVGVLSYVLMPEQGWGDEPFRFDAETHIPDRAAKRILALFTVLALVSAFVAWGIHAYILVGMFVGILGVPLGLAWCVHACCYGRRAAARRVCSWRRLRFVFVDWWLKLVAFTISLLQRRSRVALASLALAAALLVIVGATTNEMQCS